MPLVTYLRQDGTEQQLDVPVGTSVMRAAVNAELDGIVGACGGQAMCATCHVYVRSPLDRLPEMSEDEAEMLDFVAAERDPERSRLSCQLVLGSELESLVVELPATQV